MCDVVLSPPRHERACRARDYADERVRRGVELNKEDRYQEALK
jgi:hypothetical protein